MGVIPLGISLLGSLLPRERVATGIAILSATMGIGGGLGLPASAALAELVDWHALFWVSAALAVAAMLLVWLVVPPVPVVAEETLDVWGALTLAGMLASTLLVLAQGYSWGWTSPLTLAVAGAAVVFATAWYFRERYAVHPLIHLEMLAHRPVLLTNLASFAMAVSLFASTVTFPQILTLPEAEGVGLGMSLIESSWILLPSGVMMMLLSPFAGRLIARFGARALLATGGGFLALAYVWTLLASTQPWHLLVANILIGIGIGVGFSTMPTLILAAVPSVRAGEANGVNALARSLGSSTAAAIAGAVLAAGAVAGSSPSVASFRAVWMVGCAAGLACLIISCVRADARRDRA